MDASIFDPVQGYAAAVKSSGELKVEASVPGTVTVGGTVNVGSVGSTVDVNVASQSGQIEATPGSASTVSQGQVPVDSTAGGTSILGSGSSRKGFIVKNHDGANPLFLGIGVTPTTANGIRVGPGETFSLPAGITTDAYVKGITGAGITVIVSYLELS